MKIGLLLLLLALFASSLGSRGKFPVVAQRARMLRGPALAWLAGLGLLAALALLPGRARVVLLLPVLLGGVALVSSWWRRMREPKQVDFAKMKRVHIVREATAFGNPPDRDYPAR